MTYNEHLDRDLHKSEAESLAKVLNNISIDAKSANGGGLWVVVGTLDDSTTYIINTRREHDAIRSRMHTAAMNFIKKED